MSCPHDPDGEREGRHRHVTTPMGMICSCGHVLENQRRVTLHFALREDGGLQVRSDDLSGLVLSAQDRDAVWRDLGMAIKYLLARNHDWPEPTRPGFESVN